MRTITSAVNGRPAWVLRPVGGSVPVLLLARWLSAASLSTVRFSEPVQFVQLPGRSLSVRPIEICSGFGQHRGMFSQISLGQLGVEV